MELLSPTPLSIDHVEEGRRRDGTESGTGEEGYCTVSLKRGRGMAACLATAGLDSFPFKDGYYGTRRHGAQKQIDHQSLCRNQHNTTIDELGNQIHLLLIAYIYHSMAEYLRLHTDGTERGK